MKVPMRSLLAFAGMTLMVGCAGMEYEEAARSPASGSSFQRDLHGEYVNLSKSEFDQGDYVDSDRYAEKALALSDRQDVQPQGIGDRDLPEDKVQDLTSARSRLMAAMAAGAAEEKPLDAASAQANFDCWMEQQEENFQPDHIAACRDGFMTAIAALEAQPQVTAAPEPAPPAPAPETEPMAAPAAYTVHFEFNEAGLTPDARVMLADVVANANKSDYQTIDVSGYTDLVGSDAYNQVLSEQRANAVINFLVDSGIEAGKIVGRGYGKADPVVPVETPEMQNRRVEIKLEP